MVGSVEDVFSLLCLMLEDTSFDVFKTERLFWDCVRGGAIREEG